MMKEKIAADNGHDRFFDRDLSWLSFNERVLDEAKRSDVPIMERVRFLTIYSSNLDEFYRVRVPSLMALNKLSSGRAFSPLLATINDRVLTQQQQFGHLLRKQILPALRRHGIRVIYDESIPRALSDLLRDYFIHTVASFIHVTQIRGDTAFFPENNKLYFAITTGSSNHLTSFYVINIPSDALPRFYVIENKKANYIFFLDDIILANLDLLVPEGVVHCHSFKITRDAELDLEDEFSGNLAKKIEKKISKRDYGLATRVLHDPGIPSAVIEFMKKRFGLSGANFISGGRYHNLRDLSSLPLHDSMFNYESWPQKKIHVDSSLFASILQGDLLLHPPYHAYDTILRFFNEAAIDPSTERIFVTFYRIAHESRIASALISAAKNGKKVVVFVEMKARFDEANNIKWAKKMKAAGIQIIESIPGLKVHAKLALVKRRNRRRAELFGLLATGNFNESTARYYTDHILMTAHRGIVKEMEHLFGILKKKRKNNLEGSEHKFRHLLVGQFNLQDRFLQLLDREIGNARKGLPASVTIKLNNLEERVLISKLYQASGEGVCISLIVRSICCLVPGIPGMSENITVRRIVDRYLEHGRIFIFHNNGQPEVYLGSADWMNRNIYRRIEVCFPLFDDQLKAEINDLIALQLNDNSRAVVLDEHCCNQPLSRVAASTPAIRSQRAIANYLCNLSSGVENEELARVGDI